MRCYVEVPLTSPAGYVIGSYCIVDNKLREDLDDECVRILSETSMAIMEHLENMKIKQTHFRTNQLLEGLGMFMDGDTCLNSTARMHKRQRGKGLFSTSTTGGSIENVPIENAQPKNESRVFTLPESANSSSFLSSSDGFVPSPAENANAKGNYFPAITTGDVADETIPNPEPDKTADWAVPISEAVAPGKPHTRIGVTRPKSRQKKTAIASEAQNVLAMAGSLIRNSMDISGVLFLDAHSTYQKPTVDVASSSSLEPNAPLSPNFLKTADDEDIEMVSAVLGRSMSARAANKDTQDENLLELPEELLQRLIDSYPIGQIFSCDELGPLIGRDEIGT